MFARVSLPKSDPYVARLTANTFMYNVLERASVVKGHPASPCEPIAHPIPEHPISDELRHGACSIRLCVSFASDSRRIFIEWISCDGKAKSRILNADRERPCSVYAVRCCTLRILSSSSYRSDGHCLWWCAIGITNKHFTHTHSALHDRSEERLQCGTCACMDQFERNRIWI